MIKRRIILTGGVAAAATLAAPAVWAAYPDRPIRFICPFPAGGVADGIVRSISTQLGEKLGVTVVVDNRPGASTLIGAEFVKAAKPDGYTLMLGTSSMNMLVLRKQGTTVDSRKDLDQVIAYAESEYGFFANPAAPFKTLPEMIEYAKANPDKVTVGNTGTGTTPHLIVEYLNIAAGIKTTSVPYKGGAPMAVGLMGGEIMMGCDAMGSTNPLIREGRIRLLATTGTGRSKVFPAVPAANEAVPNFVVRGLSGILTSPGTPKEIIGQINAAMLAVMAMPEVRERFEKISLNPITTTPAQYRQLTIDEVATWSRVVKEAGVVIE